MEIAKEFSYENLKKSLICGFLLKGPSKRERFVFTFLNRSALLGEGNGAGKKGELDFHVTMSVKNGHYPHPKFDGVYVFESGKQKLWAFRLRSNLPDFEDQLKILNSKMKKVTDRQELCELSAALGVGSARGSGSLSTGEIISRIIPEILKRGSFLEAVVLERRPRRGKSRRSHFRWTLKFEMIQIWNYALQRGPFGGYPKKLRSDFKVCFVPPNDFDSGSGRKVEDDVAVGGDRSLRLPKKLFELLKKRSTTHARVLLGVSLNKFYPTESKFLKITFFMIRRILEVVGMRNIRGEKVFPGIQKLTIELLIGDQLQVWNVQGPKVERKKRIEMLEREGREWVDKKVGWDNIRTMEEFLQKETELEFKISSSVPMKETVKGSDYVRIRKSFIEKMIAFHSHVLKPEEFEALFQIEKRMWKKYVGLLNENGFLKRAKQENAAEVKKLNVLPLVLKSFEKGSFEDLFGFFERIESSGSKLKQLEKSELLQSVCSPSAIQQVLPSEIKVEDVRNVLEEIVLFNSKQFADLREKCQSIAFLMEESVFFEYLDRKRLCQFMIYPGTADESLWMHQSLVHRSRREAYYFLTYLFTRN